MNAQQITVHGASLWIPSYYQQVDSLPDDPEESAAYAVQSKHALCMALFYPIRESETIPRDSHALIDGSRRFLSKEQGLIQVETGEEFAYSIVKTMMHPGVEYTLTMDKYFSDTIVRVQGHFQETGDTGIRDNIVYEYCRKNGIVGNEEDPFWNWTLDPYDPAMTEGALRNYSERDVFDEYFPDFPLSLCRTLADTVLSFKGESA